jgi:hypothetical protein
MLPACEVCIVDSRLWYCVCDPILVRFEVYFQQKYILQPYDSSSHIKEIEDKLGHIEIKLSFEVIAH